MTFLDSERHETWMSRALLLSEGMSWMTGQSRVEDGIYLWMIVQVLCNLGWTLHNRFHSHRQSFQSSSDQIAIKWGWNCPDNYVTFWKRKNGIRTHQCLYLLCSNSGNNWKQILQASSYHFDKTSDDLWRYHCWLSPLPKWRQHDH